MKYMTDIYGDFEKRIAQISGAPDSENNKDIYHRL